MKTILICRKSADKWQDGLVRLVNEMPSLNFNKPGSFVAAA